MDALKRIAATRRWWDAMSSVGKTRRVGSPKSWEVRAGASFSSFKSVRAVKAPSKLVSHHLNFRWFRPICYAFCFVELVRQLRPCWSRDSNFAYAISDHWGHSFNQRLETNDWLGNSEAIRPSARLSHHYYRLTKWYVFSRFLDLDYLVVWWLETSMD